MSLQPSAGPISSSSTNWATCPCAYDGAGLLSRIIADPYERRSIIFTSNLEFSRWGDVFGDGDMAAAVIDRIIHHGRIIRFTGESYRNTHSLMK